jgi:hypothetical protein
MFVWMVCKNSIRVQYIALYYYYITLQRTYRKSQLQLNEKQPLLLIRYTVRNSTTIIAVWTTCDLLVIHQNKSSFAGFSQTCFAFRSASDRSPIAVRERRQTPNLYCELCVLVLLLVANALSVESDWVCTGDYAAGVRLLSGMWSWVLCSMALVWICQINVTQLRKGVMEGFGILLPGNFTTRPQKLQIMHLQNLFN